MTIGLPFPKGLLRNAAALSLLDQEPFSFFSKAGQPVNLGEGRAELRTTLFMPLKPRVTLPDVTFVVSGRIVDFTSPALVPGPYAMVPYTEHVGIYYPRGGMIKIPEALQRCGERHGMEVRFNTRVEQVMVRGGRAEGVVLADGSQVSSKLVVSDINARTLYLKMIGEQHLPSMAVRGLRSYAYSISVPMVYVGLDYEPPLDGHHSVIAASPTRSSSSCVGLTVTPRSYNLLTGTASNSFSLGRRAASFLTFERILFR